MAIYIANVNGDWWEFTSDQPLYVLDTDLLSHEEEEYVNESLDSDKFERVIMEYGKRVNINGSI